MNLELLLLHWLVLVFIAVRIRLGMTTSGNKSLEKAFFSSFLSFFLPLLFLTNYVALCEKLFLAPSSHFLIASSPLFVLTREVRPLCVVREMMMQHNEICICLECIYYIYKRNASLFVYLFIASFLSLRLLPLFLFPSGRGRNPVKRYKGTRDERAGWK